MENKELYEYYGKEYSDRLLEHKKLLINKFYDIIKNKTFSDKRKSKECALFCLTYVKTCDPVTVDHKHLQMRLIDNIEETVGFYMNVRDMIAKSISK